MVTCRPASKDDAEGIAHVLVESYNIDNVEEGKEVFSSETAKDHHYIVAVEENKIVGIVTWYQHGLPKHQLCELVRIAVLSDQRGKGIAKPLFEALVNEAKAFFESKGQKLRKLFLQTHADNERAQKFYEKLGFTHETTLKDHYYQDKDEFVYSVFF